MSETAPRYTPDQLQQEWAAIHREITEWRCWWTEVREMGIPHFGEMALRIGQIREQLKQHFQHEEQTNPFVSLTDPCDQATARSLLQEHQTLLEDLDAFIKQLEECGCDEMCWGDARLAFEQFLSRLSAHEDQEHRLISALQAPSTPR